MIQIEDHFQILSLSPNRTGNLYKKKRILSITPATINRFVKYCSFFFVFAKYRTINPTKQHCNTDIVHLIAVILVGIVHRHETKQYPQKTNAQMLYFTVSCFIIILPVSRLHATIPRAKICEPRHMICISGNAKIPNVKKRSAKSLRLILILF